MELLVAMVLTGLIMLAGMTALSDFIHLVNTIKKNNEQESQIIQLFEIMDNDVSRSEKVFFNDKLECIRGESKTSYQFSENYVVRTSFEYSDTIKVSFDKPRIEFFENTELVCHILIPCKNRDIVIPLDIIKIYPLGMTIEKIK